MPCTLNAMRQVCLQHPEDVLFEFCARQVKNGHQSPDVEEEARFSMDVSNRNCSLQTVNKPAWPCSEKSLSPQLQIQGSDHESETQSLNKTTLRSRAMCPPQVPASPAARGQVMVSVLRRTESRLNKNDNDNSSKNHHEIHTSLSFSGAGNAACWIVGPIS